MYPHNDSCGLCQQTAREAEGGRGGEIPNRLRAGSESGPGYSRPRHRALGRSAVTTAARPHHPGNGESPGPAPDPTRRHRNGLAGGAAPGPGTPPAGTARQRPPLHRQHGGVSSRPLRRGPALPDSASPPPAPRPSAGRDRRRPLTPSRSRHRCGAAGGERFAARAVAAALRGRRKRGRRSRRREEPLRARRAGAGRRTGPPLTPPG